jgi:PAS domain S-box-containing protein
MRELTSLRLKEARLRSLVEKLPASILRLSADGIVLATNDRAVSLLGANSANQLLKKSFDPLVHQDGREAWTDFVVRVCAGETRSTEVAITTLDGIAPYHMIATLAFDSVAAVQSALASPQGKAVADDLANFASGGVEIMIADTQLL